MPIRHVKGKGWYWGSKGPFASRKKAEEVARAAYASGYHEKAKGWLQGMRKHADHDQSDHGNWARAGERAPGAALSTLRSEGGFTLDEESGHVPKEGWAVAVPGHERVYEEDRLSVDVMRDYVTQNTEALALPGAHWGGWYDVESGKVFLDVSIVVGTEDEARMLGQQYKQLAIYNLALGEEVRLDKSKPRIVGTFLPEDPEEAYKVMQRLIARARESVPRDA